VLEARIIGEVQDAAKLSATQLAKLIGVEPSELMAPTPTVLADCAQLMGVSVSELLTRKTGPAAPLYRTASGHPPLVAALAEDGAALSIGGFIRDLRLADELDLQPRSIPLWATFRRLSEDSETPHGADELADLVREKSGLGLDPVPSVWQLAKDLGIRCAAITPDDLTSSVTGISWRDPAYLVGNLVGGASAWWRTRMTVAHEIGHLLFDLPQLGLALSGDRQGRFGELFDLVEQRANAFAAYLLLPRRAVLGLVGNSDPMDPQFVLRLSAEYQVSTTVAANVVRYSHNLTEHQRNQLVEQTRFKNVLGPTHPDATPPLSPRRQLLSAVEGAVERGQLDPVRARTILGLRMADALPFGGASARAPVLGLAHRIRNTVTQHLLKKGRSDLACTGEATLRPGDRYEVQLLDAATGRETGERVFLTTHDLRIIDAA
jgi:hypothetical protein